MLALRTYRITALEASFQKRSGQMYQGMKRRAKKVYVSLPFTLAEFREWLRDKFDVNGVARCEYSNELIAVENFSVDHRHPVSRSGSFDLLNLAICTEKHNLRKGNMTGREYEFFMTHVIGFYPPEVQAAIWRKLEVGDVQRFSHFRRQRKAKQGAV